MTYNIVDIDSKSAILKLIEDAIVGLYDLQDGGYNAATNTPNLTSPAAGAVRKGYAYPVVVGGAFFTDNVSAGDTIIALVDDPSSLSDYLINEENLNQATETQYGYAALATQALTDAGADDLTIVTPLKLRNTSLANRDTQAFHSNVAGEFAALTEVLSLGNDDKVVLELDSAGNAKRFIRGSNIGGGVTNPMTVDLDVDGFCLVGNAVNRDVCIVPGTNGVMGNAIVRDPTSLNELRFTRAGGVWRIDSDGNAGGRTITINNNFATAGSINFQMGTGGFLALQRVGSAYSLAANGGFAGNIDLGSSPTQDFRNIWLGNQIKDTRGINELEITVDATTSGLFNKKLAFPDVLSFNQSKLQLTRSHFGDYVTNQSDCEYFIGGEATAGAPQTVGPLVSGGIYRINGYVAGDDFTNVGGTNSTNDIFKATGTTPTTWTNASTLQRLGENFPIDTVIEGSNDYPTLAEFIFDDVATANNLASSSKFITWKLVKTGSDQWDLSGTVPEFFELKFSGGEADGNFPIAVSGIDFKGTDSYPPIYTSEATIVAYSEDGDDCDAEIEDITNTNTICSTSDFTNTDPEIISMGAVSNLPTSAAIFELQGGNDDKKKSALFYEARLTFNKPE